MNHHAKAPSSGSSMRQGNRPAIVRGALALALTLVAFLGIGASAAMAAPPTVTLDPITVNSITTAHATGEVSVDSEANGGFETSWCFESTPEGQEAWSQATCGGPVAPGTSEPVAGDFTGLAAGTKYEARISYLNFNDFVTEYSNLQSFETDPAAVAPTFVLGPPEAVSYTSAHISGTFNPEGGNEDAVAGPIPITAQLEINREGQGWNPVGSSLTVEGSDAVSSQDFELEADPTALAAGAEYKYRLLAHYAGLTAETEEADWGEFTTLDVAKPTISNFAISAVTTESAHFSAEVDPGGTDPAFDASWHFECTPSCSGLESGTVSGAAGTVESGATGLAPNTFYTVRLYAENAGGTTKETETFTTGASAPLVNSFAAGPVGPTSAAVNAEINPRGSSTVYWFEWGTEDCSAPGAGCTSIPDTHDASAGSDNLFHYFSRTLTNLTPGATYHFRVVATNASGTTEGDDQTFTTAAAPPAECANEARRVEQHATELPDCRAYELVSPPDKNGGDVRIESSKIRIADDGGAAIFTSYVSFGDAKGTSLEVTYLSRRDAGGENGWNGHAISPLQEPLTIRAVTGNSISDFEPTFTPDLSAGIYRSWRPIAPSPNTDNINNIYLLDGLRSGVPAQPLLLSDAVAQVPVQSQFGVFRPVVVGASEDLSHVIFESKAPLTAPNPPPIRTKLYESVNGSVRLAGVLPDGTPAARSTAGGGSNEVSTTFYPAPHSISTDGSHVFFSEPTAGGVYVRIDGTTTELLNPSGIAKFYGASADGSRAFFTTAAGLVGGDDDGLTDLYMWTEAPDSEGHHLTLLSVDSEPRDSAGNVNSVIGVSDDGHYVYFDATGQIVAGQPLGLSSGIYLWHDGAISYVGHFLNSEDAEVNSFKRFTFLVEQRAARVSPDGRHLLFMTRGDVGLKGRGGFPGYDHGGGCTYDVIPGPCRELYVYSADSGRLACASCNPTGAPATADALDSVRAGVGVATWHENRALSVDGRHVFFTTREALLPEDTNGALDAYEYDGPTGQVHLLSSGTDSSDSYFAEASPSGDALIVTRQRLLGWDTDKAYDLYDVRVGGGLPEPPPVPAACEGESCRAAPESGPGVAPIASAQPGPGNRPQGRRPCPKGKRAVSKKGKSRCVKRHSKHRRTANTNRRAGR